MQRFDIKNKVLFITGAGRKNGIGHALVVDAIKKGAKKVYATARNQTHVQQLKDAFSENVTPMKLDVTDLKAVRKAAEDAQVLINNAGVVSPSSYLGHFNPDIAHLEMETNYFGPMYLINAFKECLFQNQHSAIVNIISVGGLYPAPIHVTYSASKAALYSSTQALRIEMHRAQHPIPVFGVYPGPINTDMTKDMNTPKATSKEVALRVFDGMKEGVLDITTDAFSDHFKGFFKQDPELLGALRAAL